MPQYDLHGVYLTLIRGCSDADVRPTCCEATRGMISITRPWLEPHHVTRSRNLREPSINLIFEQGLSCA